MKRKTDRTNSPPLLRIRKLVVIPPESKMSVRVGTQGAGLVFLARHPIPMRKRRFLPASETINVFPAVVSPVLLANVSSKPSILPIRNILGIGIDLPNFVIHLHREAVTHPKEWMGVENTTVTDLSQPSTVRKESKGDQMYRHELISTVDGTDQENDW